ncbi:MAG: hypothetical protein OXT71_08895 [Acidobacteriota bacterium]|nr:hypothetical protein [Acidobacteriota bacterium]
MSKDTGVKSLAFVVGIFPLPLLLGAGHYNPLTTTPEPLKVLIAPIYPQNWPLTTYVTLFEARGRAMGFYLHEFTETGHYVLGEGERHFIGSNSSKTISFFHDFSGRRLGNGWARYTYRSQDRKLEGFVTVAKYKQPTPEDGHEREVSARIKAVEPARSFRLLAYRDSIEETAISIVNPTEEEQTVTVRLYGGWTIPISNARPDPRFVEKSWTLGPMTRLSRFLSELLPIEGYDDSTGRTDDRPGRTHGIVHVQGETQIAVGALGFDHETGEFWGLPVFAEPPEHP